MDPEQLAAYVAGELDADEHARIEAALARDPALRAEVERLEVAERALQGLAPAEPPEGFGQRLRDAVAPTLDEVLDAAHPSDEGDGPAAWASGGDELAARRAPGRWVTAALGAAAGLALLGVVGVAFLGVPGGDDAAQESVMDSADDSDGGLTSAESGDGPVVLATGRDLREGDVAELFDQPALEGLRARRLDLTSGGDLARAYTEQLRHDALVQDDAEVPETEDSDDATGAAGEAAPEAYTGTDRVTDDETAVARCLEVLLEGSNDTAPIPVYVELLNYEGEPAIAYGMLTPGRDGQAYDRAEIWIVDRAQCQVRQLRQADG